MRSEIALEQLVSMARTEAAAVETYRRASMHIKGKSGARTIRQLQSEHSYAVKRLNEQILKLGGDVEICSGIRGALDMALQGTANLFGLRKSLLMLKRSEERTFKHYLEAADDTALPVESREVIRRELLPRQRENIEALSEIIKMEENT